ncbi:MAG: hypothetical protein NC489_39585 [Ruminococcus flavefaciens]|nr:hypothetical protein [Ruminococcus flavefaciens]
MNIYISYSPECSVEYCFWKYFFQVSGFWVKEERIAENWRIKYNQTPHLVIFDKKHEKNYGTECPRIVYCVRKSSKVPPRRDLIKSDWWKGYYYSVLNQLFGEDDDLLPFLKRMMRIFVGANDPDRPQDTGNGLWSAVWLFHEIAQMAARENWDRQIADKAAESARFLKKERSSTPADWHCLYAILYCEYMQYGVNRSGIYRMREGQRLLEKCRELSVISGWSPALSFLAGRICLLTSTQNKYAVHYYSTITEREVQPDLLYETGHIYEKAYGDKKRAWHYYQLVYRQDPNYYRAVYKIALKLEAEDDWLHALGTYSRVRKIIECLKVKNDISIRGVEYEYKSCKKILQLCRWHINDIEFQDSYRRRIIDMNENPGSYINFDKITKHMFTESELAQKRQEIMEELRSRLDTDCCY